MNTVVGFTGSRKGMKPNQIKACRLILERAAEAHHGDCVGADAEFHELCLELHVPVIIHPPDNDRHRAFCRDALEVLPPKPYLERNMDIVDASEVLVAAPKERDRPVSLRGQGTWWTIGYANRRGCMTLHLVPR
jgi:hypothetical protein